MSPGAESVALCQSQLAIDDFIVLVDRGVELLLQPTVLRNLGREGQRIWFLQADVQARGIGNDSQAEPLTDDEWAELICNHEQVLSWT